MACYRPHVADYSALSIKFYHEGKFITLKGEKPKLPAQAQLHHIRRLHHTHVISELFTIHVSGADAIQDTWLELATQHET